MERCVQAMTWPRKKPGTSGKINWQRVFPHTFCSVVIYEGICFFQLEGNLLQAFQESPWNKTPCLNPFCCKVEIPPGEKIASPYSFKAPISWESGDDFKCWFSVPMLDVLWTDRFQLQLGDIRTYIIQPNERIQYMARQDKTRHA